MTAEPRCMSMLLPVTLYLLIGSSFDARTPATHQVTPVLHVDDDAPAGGDGGSWTVAFRFLQDALAVAADPTTGVEEIRIAQGVYRPDQSQSHPDGSGDRHSTFDLVEGLTLRGGYAGLLGTQPDAHDPERYPTILSGDLAGDDGPGFVNTDENALHVVTAVEIDPIQMEGLIITAGNANGEEWPENVGGGMLHFLASPTVVNCVFAANEAVIGGGLYSFGYVEGISDCMFIGNMADEGGGLAGARMFGTISSCEFRHNDAQNRGGAASMSLNGRPLIVDCTFTSNTAGTDGGAVYNTFVDADYVECTFQNNIADTGGAVAIRDDLLPLPHPTMVYFTDCTFQGNMAEVGGAIYDSAQPTVGPGRLEGCLLKGNSASLGGAVFAHGSEMEAEQSIFMGNQALLGGAFYTDSGAPVLTGCTFDANSAELDGGGLYAHAGAASLHDCLFTGNAAVIHGGGMYADDGSVLQDCTFEYGAAHRGGGFYCFGSAPSLISCTFLLNEATEQGAGMFNLQGSPLLAGCLFEANHSDVGEGAGMASEAGSAAIIGCSFTANDARVAGGLYVRDSIGETIDDCTFQLNVAESSGGAMFLSHSHVTLCRSWFEGNTAGGGGAISDNHGMIEISDCTFTGNHAGSSGAISLGLSLTLIKRSVFQGNTAAQSGGAIGCSSAALSISDCVVSGNGAGDGGASQDGGGGLFATNSTSLQIANSLFSGNTANGRGGAVKIRTIIESAEFINCTFSANTATLVGDVLHTDSYVPSMNNSILWGNGWDPISGDSSISYSCVEGGWPGTGNIDSDPGFIDLGGDFRLAAGSPCIDAADNDAVPAGVTTDLSVLPRFIDDPATVDTGNGDAPLVDMGAYEFQAGLCAADIDGDGTAGFSDLILIVDAWGEAGPEDIDGSGTVDFTDLLMLLTTWGPC